VNKNADFPDWGKFKSVAVTASEDESHSTWVYVVSVHFEQGTLPLIIRQNASAPDAVNKSYFTTSTNSKLNSAYYVRSQGKWLNAIAEDYNADSYMRWRDNNETTIGLLAYSTATLWGWDYGHQSGGHPTVFTNRYTAQLSNGNTVLKIYDGSGNLFATYTAQ
jgi:bisphosphoglycerate-dependent phosphoglycerate mutase